MRHIGFQTYSERAIPVYFILYCVCIPFISTLSYLNPSPEAHLSKTAYTPIATSNAEKK